MKIQGIVEMLWCYCENIYWSAFAGVLSTLGDICLFWISIYTFRLTIFPKKLKFINYRERRSVFEGDSFEITLENRSICPVVISSLELIFGSNRVKVFDGYRVVEGFKVETIKM